MESDVQEDCERVNDILLKAGATDVRLAQDEAERVRFWAGRKNAFPAVGRISPITTAWMAPSRVAPCLAYWKALPVYRSNMIYVLPTSFMPEMATCTR